MIVSIQSIIDNASKEKLYRIHILHTNICSKMRQIVEEMANENFEICFEDVSKYLDTMHDKLPIRDYYSLTTYFRMYIADMFPEYDKAIYIDSDTIVLGDIAELYNHDIEDAYVGAANEQVMVQIDTYGEYVEKVLGIDRNHYFNAGLLLINCKQFRENKVLERFMELLYSYNFVVTQDEDYLNILCQDKVYWLKQQWNTEVIGEPLYEDSEIAMIHYIMFSKPWHYRGQRYENYFWKYAEKTVVYEEIKSILESYTDEEREADKKSGERLLQTAKDEIAKENNYLNMKNKGLLKSYDRLLVLGKIAMLEREGKFDVDVEEDPPTRELRQEEIDYLRKKVSSKIKTHLTYQVARSFMNNMIKNKQLIIKEIKGIENFSNLQSGAIITCNHFNALDSFAIQITYESAKQKGRKFYRVIREGNYTNFPGFYGLLMRNCNTFPLSSNMETMKKFMKSMDAVLRNGHFVLIYPEQSMWWNYRKPKPLKKGAFTFAARNHVPVLPCFITMQDSDVLGEDGFYVQEYTVHVSEPIYPDSTKSNAENVEAMRQKNYELWKQIYEETYQESLVYSCDESNGNVS